MCAWFTVFCIVRTVFLYCFVYRYLFLLVLSVLVEELRPPSENPIVIIIILILKSELNTRNTITAIGAVAVPVLTYSFGIINGTLEEIKKIYRKTRNMLTVYQMHHSKADIDRLYLKRKEGGRGLVQVEAAYKAQIINIAEYLNTNYKDDQFVNIVKNHENTQPNMNSVLKLATKIVEELNQPHVKSDGTQHTKARLREGF